MKPLFIPPLLLRPLQGAQRDAPCRWCDRRQARWALTFEPGYICVCSLCFLYDSEWGKENAALVESFLCEFEKEINTSFQRSRGRIANARDGDRMLAAVALTSRMFAVRDRMTKIGGAS